MASADEQLAALLQDPINRVLARMWDRVEAAHAADFMDAHGREGPLDEAGRQQFMVNSLLAVRQELDDLYQQKMP